MSHIFLQLSILIVSGYSLSINLVHKDGAQKGEFKVEFFCKNKQLFLDVFKTFKVFIQKECPDVKRAHRVSRISSCLVSQPDPSNLT